MNPHVRPSATPATLSAALPQVLYIGRSRSAPLIAALRGHGVDVIVAFDTERGAVLLNYLHPHAILCEAADARAVLAYAPEPDVQVIVLGNEEWARTHPATTVVSSTSAIADIVHRVRREIAAQESGATSAGATIHIHRNIARV